MTVFGQLPSKEEGYRTLERASNVERTPHGAVLDLGGPRVSVRVLAPGLVRIAGREGSYDPGPRDVTVSVRGFASQRFADTGEARTLVFELGG